MLIDLNLKMGKDEVIQFKTRIKPSFDYGAMVNTANRAPKRKAPPRPKAPKKAPKKKPTRKPKTMKLDFNINGDGKFAIFGQRRSRLTPIN